MLVLVLGLGVTDGEQKPQQWSQMGPGPDVRMRRAGVRSVSLTWNAGTCDGFLHGHLPARMVVPCALEFLTLSRTLAMHPGSPGAIIFPEKKEINSAS